MKILAMNLGILDILGLSEMPEEGVEPSRPKALDPKSSVATSYTTPARRTSTTIRAPSGLCELDGLYRSPGHTVPV